MLTVLWVLGCLIALALIYVPCWLRDRSERP